MKWRYFAERELPRVVRELGLPCAEPALATGMSRCPRHRQPLDEITRTCPDCRTEAWDEVARRYRTADPAEEEDPMQPEPVKAELVPVDAMIVDDDAPVPTTLFHTSDPDVALERMSRIARKLVDVVDDRRLYATIRGHRHITAEGWSTLGAMCGVVPVVVWTKPNESGDGILARVEARTLDGRVVGAAESECSRAETRWRDADAYAIRSMAQTRAIGRALRAPLGQIVVLAGYQPAAAEEMPGDVDGTATRTEPEPEAEGAIPDAVKPDPSQIERMQALLRTLEEIEPGTDWQQRCRDLAGVPGRLLTRAGAAQLIEKLEAELAAKVGKSAA